MNFVLNIDPKKKTMGEVNVVTSLSGVCVDTAEHAPLVYLEYRFDPESRENFVCMVFRTAEA
jgi:hypothetical protein